MGGGAFLDGRHLAVRSLPAYRPMALDRGIPGGVGGRASTSLPPIAYHHVLPHPALRLRAPFLADEEDASSLTAGVSVVSRVSVDPPADPPVLPARPAAAAPAPAVSAAPVPASTTSAVPAPIPAESMAPPPAPSTSTAPASAPADSAAPAPAPVASVPVPASSESVLLAYLKEDAARRADEARRWDAAVARRDEESRRREEQFAQSQAELIQAISAETKARALPPLLKLSDAAGWPAIWDPGGTGDPIEYPAGHPLDNSKASAAVRRPVWASHRASEQAPFFIIVIFIHSTQASSILFLLTLGVPPRFRLPCAPMGGVGSRVITSDHA